MPPENTPSSGVGISPSQLPSCHECAEIFPLLADQICQKCQKKLDISPTEAQAVDVRQGFLGRPAPIDFFFIAPASLPILLHDFCNFYACDLPKLRLVLV